jgi:hypothetical protein
VEHGCWNAYLPPFRVAPTWFLARLSPLVAIACTNSQAPSDGQEAVVQIQSKRRDEHFNAVGCRYFRDASGGLASRHFPLSVRCISRGFRREGFFSQQSFLLFPFRSRLAPLKPQHRASFLAGVLKYPKMFAAASAPRCCASQPHYVRRL